MLRRIIWKLSKKAIATSIIRRRVLELFRCDNMKMLMAAKDNYGE